MRTVETGRDDLVPVAINDQHRSQRASFPLRQRARSLPRPGYNRRCPDVVTGRYGSIRYHVPGTCRRCATSAEHRTVSGTSSPHGPARRCRGLLAIKYDLTGDDTAPTHTGEPTTTKSKEPGSFLFSAARSAADARLLDVASHSKLRRGSEPSLFSSILTTMQLSSSWLTPTSGRCSPARLCSADDRHC